MRTGAIEWTKAAAPHELAGLVPIVAMDAKPDPPVAVRESGDDAEKLQLCVDAAIAEAALPGPSSKPGG